jgi:hypothetical protein
MENVKLVNGEIKNMTPKEIEQRQKDILNFETSIKEAEEKKLQNIALAKEIEDEKIKQRQSMLSKLTALGITEEEFTQLIK